MAPKMPVPKEGVVNAIIKFEEKDPFSDSFNLKVEDDTFVKFEDNNGFDGVQESDFLNWIQPKPTKDEIKDYLIALRLDGVINKNNKIKIVNMNESNFKNFKAKCKNPVVYSQVLETIL